MVNPLIKMNRIIKYGVPIVAVIGLYAANFFYQKSNIEDLQTELQQDRQELKQTQTNYEDRRNDDNQKRFTISTGMLDGIIKVKRSNEKVSQLESSIKTAERKAITIL